MITSSQKPTQSHLTRTKDSPANQEIKRDLETLTRNWGAKTLCVCVCMHVCTQSCLTFCDPRVCSPSSISVRGISQARILEWVAISFSRETSPPRDQTRISWGSCIVGGFFTAEPLICIFSYYFTNIIYIPWNLPFSMFNFGLLWWSTG